MKAAPVMGALLLARTGCGANEDEVTAPVRAEIAEGRIAGAEEHAELSG